MSTKTSEASGSKKAPPGRQTADAQPQHDQDSDSPRTAVPPGSPKTPAETTQSKDPAHDQDSDPPRTAVPPKL
jgi:hypothetical protein